MRVPALLALAASAAIANADVLDDIESVATEVTSSVGSVVESVTQSGRGKPTYTPTALKAPFFEQFDDDSRWVRSSAKKENTEEEWAYVGTWNNEEPSVLRGIDGDKGLVLKDKAAHHAISAKFDKPISNKDETLVVQYEVKLQNGLECGGAYMKLLQDSSLSADKEFSNASPYIIMFGPDKCGSTNKVHFIFRHKNPKTGEYEEKHLQSPPTARISTQTHLYTLIVKPDQTYEILIDGESQKSGSLFEDFEPSVNPPKEIPDPDDLKPSDWVDDEEIADPKATKPEDWDEDAPFEIIDESAVKPDDWLENEPETIPDPEAEKPADWDDEEDGDWIAPTIPNPKCDDVSGCGPWTKPTIQNPAYKGKWSAPMIENPAYKGIWEPRNIANPNYYEDKKPADFEPMGAIGFELWTMQNDILFDNIYIGHSVADAVTLQKSTFDIKRAAEEALEKAEAVTAGEIPAAPQQVAFLDDPVTYLTDKFDLFLTIARRDPIEAVKAVPEISGVIGVGLVTIFAILSGAFAGSKAAPSAAEIKAKAAEAKDAVKKTANDAAGAVASGAEKAKDEVNKRTTRSSN